MTAWAAAQAQPRINITFRRGRSKACTENYYRRVVHPIAPVTNFDLINLHCVSRQKPVQLMFACLSRRYNVGDHAPLRHATGVMKDMLPANCATKPPA